MLSTLCFGDLMVLSKLWKHFLFWCIWLNVWSYLGEAACWAADSSVPKWNLLRASEQAFIQWDLFWIIDDSEIAVVCLCVLCVFSRAIREGGDRAIATEKVKDPEGKHQVYKWNISPLYYQWAAWCVRSHSIGPEDTACHSLFLVGC